MISGRLEPFFETGTEGVIWSVNDPSMPGYDGLWPLYNGDHLRIIGVHDETVWAGTIEFEYERNWQRFPYNPSHGQQAVNDFWVHGLERTLAPETWAAYFFEQYRAELTLGPEQRPFRRQHPFLGPSAEMATRLRTAPNPEELYRHACYPWLWFYSNGEYYSLAKHWQFTLPEILQLLGSPTEQQVAAWKTYPKIGNNTLIPFNWETFERVALLFGVYGGLNRKYHRQEDAAAWLIETGSKDLLLGGSIAQVRDAVYCA